MYDVYIHPGCMLKFDTRVWFKLPRYLAIPPAVSFLVSVSCSCPFPFSYTVVSLLELSEPTQTRLSRGSAKKRSYVQWWQELISNFLHNDCIISRDSGNLAYITEAAGGCRSGWRLSSPEAPLTEIRERAREKFTLSLFTDAASTRNWEIENSRFEPFSWTETNAFVFVLEYNIYTLNVPVCVWVMLF